MRKMEILKELYKDNTFSACCNADMKIVGSFGECYYLCDKCKERCESISG